MRPTRASDSPLARSSQPKRWPVYSTQTVSSPLWARPGEDERDGQAGYQGVRPEGLRLPTGLAFPQEKLPLFSGGRDSGRTKKP